MHSTECLCYSRAIFCDRVCAWLHIEYSSVIYTTHSHTVRRYQIDNNMRPNVVNTFDTTEAGDNRGSSQTRNRAVRSYSGRDLRAKRFECDNRTSAQIEFIRVLWLLLYIRPARAKHRTQHNSREASPMSSSSIFTTHVSSQSELLSHHHHHHHHHHYPIADLITVELLSNGDNNNYQIISRLSCTTFTMSEWIGIRGTRHEMVQCSLRCHCARLRLVWNVEQFEQFGRTTAKHARENVYEQLVPWTGQHWLNGFGAAMCAAAVVVNDRRLVVQTTLKIQTVCVWMMCVHDVYTCLESGGEQSMRACCVPARRRRANMRGYREKQRHKHTARGDWERKSLTRWMWMLWPDEQWARYDAMRG